MLYKAPKRRGGKVKIELYCIYTKTSLADSRERMDVGGM